MSTAPVELQLIDDIAGFTHDPLSFAKYAFPWGEGDLAGLRGPRKFQAEILDSIGKHLRDPQTRYQPYRGAVVSGHGIGKTALIGLVIAWGMSTCEDCKVVMTANTDDQMRTKVWPEVEKWFRLLINAHWWNVFTTSITVKDKKHEASWRCDRLTWSENNTQAFAGLHNLRKRLIVIYDEASEIADKVWEVTDGALTDEYTEIIWLTFSQGTQNAGRFFECFHKFRNFWHRWQIDAREVEGTNKQYFDELVAAWGEDSDYVRVRVKGGFPRSGFTQFIGNDLVARAKLFRSEGHNRLPRILSIDVARFGDDRSVIGDRQARKARVLKAYRGLSTTEVAQRAMEFIDKAEQNGEPYDAMVVDGDGLGAGTVDYLRLCNYDKKVPLFEFHGSAVPDDEKQYFNKRAEVWGLTREALGPGLEIELMPDCGVQWAEVEADLTGPKYGFSNKQQIQLERKEDMKKRGLASPDSGDMLAMTFAVKITKRPQAVSFMGPNIWG